MQSMTHDSRRHAIFFDLDHTLVDTDRADDAAFLAVGELLVGSGVDPDALQKTFTAAVDVQPFSPAPEVAVMVWREQLWRQALAAQNPELAERASDVCAFFYGERLRNFHFSASVSEMLVVLAQEYRLAVITNGPGLIQRPKLEACRASDFFPHILVSGEFGLAKPAPEIFHEACRLVGCKPSDAIHVGDSLAADIQGGINAGLRATVWLTANPTGQAKVRPTAVLNELTGLPALLPGFFS